VVICSLILSNHSRRTAPQASPLRNLGVRCLPRLGRGVPPRSLLTFNFELLTSSSSIFQALDSSSLGLTLNLQSEVRRLSRPEIPTRSGLSTFNRVSFLSPSSPHLCALCGENSSSFRSSLIPRHSPLTTKSFTIRTSKTPLPQLLYNPHLRAPLGSAGNKGLITPLESALTKNSPVSLLESALAERWGVRGTPVRILDSGELPWASATGDAATDVLRRSPFLATHPRTPGVPCHSLGLIPFFPSSLVTRHLPLSLARPLCRACGGHTARVR
jgi:hypothetical protein